MSSDRPYQQFEVKCSDGRTRRITADRCEVGESGTLYFSLYSNGYEWAEIATLAPGEWKSVTVKARKGGPTT